MEDYRISKFLVSLSLLFVILPCTSQAAEKHEHNREPSSPFDFIKQLQGCHRGDKGVKGIHLLKEYLKHFGYLDYHQKAFKVNHQYFDDDDFDDILESAVKTYQRNYHLNVTGNLDANTVFIMTMPRCGVPDIVNGTNWMRNHHKKTHNRHHRSTLIHTVSHYSFFEGNLRWPPSKTRLSYAFHSNTHPEVMSAVTRAFNKWASATHFSFSQVQNIESADMKIGFFRGNHNDGHSFDGRGGTLAHAFAPTDGRFHFDADEAWSIGPLAGYMDVETVALHEIGHLLGLGHSSVEGAIMWPSLSSGMTKDLHADDIQGIKALYNV